MKVLVACEESQTVCKAFRARGHEAYSCDIQEPWRKRTCLWLKGLPPLVPTNVVEPQGLWVGSSSKRRQPGLTEKYRITSNRDSKTRAKTFPGIAEAMAEQWGGFG